MIDHAEWILTRLGCEGDVIYVLAFLKVTRVIPGVEGLIRVHALEHDHSRGNRRSESRPAEQTREDIAELLKPGRDLAHFLLTGIADE